MTKSDPTTGGIGCSSISDITSAVPVKAPRNLSTSASRLAILFAEVAARSSACETRSEASFSGVGGRGSFTIFSGAGGALGGPEREGGGESGGPDGGPSVGGRGVGGESGGPVICSGGAEGGAERGGSEGGPEGGPPVGGDSGGPDIGPPIGGGPGGPPLGGESGGP